jgi:hypothetical protein
MKTTNYLLSLLILSILLSGCLSSAPTEASSVQPTPVISLSPLTLAPTPRPIQTEYPTSSATLEPEQVKDIVRTMLQESSDCLAPCFFEIHPGQTTIGNAQERFAHLGLQLEHTNKQDNQDTYALAFTLDSGLQLSLILTTEGGVVENINLGISPEQQKPDVPRDWLAFSPETLIQKYGSPSKVDLFLGRGLHTQYTMNMYFDSVDLIVEYSNLDLGKKLQICPLRDQMYSIRVWMGKKPQNTPFPGVPLEQAASLTVEDFSKLMTDNTGKACFELKEEMFP